MGKAARNPATGLTKKQDEFCFQVVLLGDPNRAYRVAYDNWTMAQATVRGEVHRLLKQPKVEERITDFQAVAERKLEVSIERIAKELACIGFSRIGDLYDDVGKPIPLHLLPDHVQRAVSSVTIVERRGGMAINLPAPAKGEEPKDKKKDRAAKAAEREGGKEEIENPASIEYVPMREKKVTLHDKQPALQTMARWKKMIQDRPAEGELDPSDPRALSDQQLEEEIRALAAAQETVAAIRKASRKVPIAKAK